MLIKYIIHRFISLMVLLCLFNFAKGQSSLEQDIDASETLQEQREKQTAMLQEQINNNNKELIKQKEYYEKQIEAYKKDLQEERVKNNFTIVGFLLSGFAILVAVFLLIKNVRKNDLLREKQQIIEEQNNELQVQAEELRQQQEEISAQRDDIMQKNFVLAQKNKLINDSMRVAAYIQQSILPKPSLLEKLFQDYFVIFKPRNIVSGDFYWVEKLGDTTLVAVVDCTGHGVPGAFVSLIVNMLLKEIVLMQKHTQPNLVLEQLNTSLKNFTQTSEENKVNIGADIALCRIRKIEEKGNELFEVDFAGARRPLLYSLPQNKEIFKIKGSKQSIGGYQYVQNIENESVRVPAKSKLFLFSDGFTDQSDGERKKIGENKLIEILKETNNLTMKEQSNILEEVFVKYQEQSEQRDDMLLVGIKL
ncbi:MAG: SpoIIE family protein phosphatase [Raineya sp.]